MRENQELLRRELLASHLHCAVSDIQKSELGIPNCFSFDGSDYQVLRDSQVTDAIQEQVIDYFDQLDVLFIQKHLKVEIPIDLLEMVVDECCSVCLLLFFELIEDTEWFFRDAIDTYGRGHFLAWYDGEEHQKCTPFDGCFFIYRLTGPEVKGGMTNEN